jgi:hypothetical protein
MAYEIPNITPNAKLLVQTANTTFMAINLNG